MIVISHLLFFCLVGAGGILFECFILGHAKSNAVRILRENLNGNTICSEEEKEWFLSLYGLPFFHHTVLWMAQINQKCTAPLGYLTMMQEYRGLSSTGRHLASGMGACLPTRTYADYKRKAVRAYNDFVDDLYDRNQAVMVCDNYNHNYRLEGISLAAERPFVSINVIVNAAQQLPHAAANAYPLQATDAALTVPSIPPHLIEIRPSFREVTIDIER